MNIREKVSQLYARNKICQTTCCGISAGQCSWSTLSRLARCIRWGSLVFIHGALRNPLCFYTIWLIWHSSSEIPGFWRMKPYLFICSGCHFISMNFAVQLELRGVRCEATTLLLEAYILPLTANGMKQSMTQVPLATLNVWHASCSAFASFRPKVCHLRWTDNVAGLPLVLIQAEGLTWNKRIGSHCEQQQTSETEYGLPAIERQRNTEETVCPTLVTNTIWLVFVIPNSLFLLYTNR